MARFIPHSVKYLGRHQDFMQFMKSLERSQQI